jgi:hypothetical protein
MPAPKYQGPTAVELKTITGPQPGVQAFKDAVMWHLAKRGLTNLGIYNRRTIRGKNGILTTRNSSLHAVGRAWDAGTADTPAGKQLGDELWLRTIHAAQQGLIGVQEVIWQRQRWTADGVKPYRGTDPHTTHLHISFSIDWAQNRAPQADLRTWVIKALGY